MKVSDIIKYIPGIQVVGNIEQVITGITNDSRTAGPNSLYVAIKGEVFDGHTFIEDAITRGARVVVCEQLPVNTRETVTYVLAASTHKVIGMIADIFYDFPSKSMKLIGVTGTNGKTTTATLLYEILEHAGYKAGLISTIENKWVLNPRVISAQSEMEIDSHFTRSLDNKIHTQSIPATRTTPDAITLRALLAQMVAAGCTHVAMEVSSHALHQGRVDGLVFACGIFTNITQDHLDYHKTIDEYILQKKKLFDSLPADAFAIMNANDLLWEEFVKTTNAKVVPFYTNPEMITAQTIEGSDIVYDGMQYHIPLPGVYNITNALGVILSLRSLGIPAELIANGLKFAHGPRGRFQVLKHKSGIIGIVDYAHTPDGVANVLQAVTHFKEPGQKIITVIGCGGNRDTGKRPDMLRHALQYSDIVIGTSDNPRNEDPVHILEQMESALASEYGAHYVRIVLRDDAIAHAVKTARQGDIVVLLGKGHEMYQEIGGIQYPFSDSEVFLHSTN